MLGAKLVHVNKMGPGCVSQIYCAFFIHIATIQSKRYTDTPTLFGNLVLNNSWLVSLTDNVLPLFLLPFIYIYMYIYIHIC